MAITEVLITVKTYPTISAKYKELVCTAGFKRDGTWVRIYPLPFRKMPYDRQYRKYDWIQLDLVINEKDFRHESYRPRSLDTDIKITGHLGTQNNWKERKNFCLKNVYSNLKKLIAEAKDINVCTSLAVFKPSKIIDFFAEPTEREWDEKKLEKLRQLNLFESTREGKFNVVKKLPYKFKYLFADDEGNKSEMMIEDWETGQLYWNCLARHKGDEQKAISDVRNKYFNDFAKTRDLYFFLGTTLVHHRVSLNPFIIIGTFHPQKEVQGSLF